MKTLMKKLVKKYGEDAKDIENWRISSPYYPNGIFYDKIEMATELGMLDVLDIPSSDINPDRDR